jgi:hypothetical protein
MSVRDRWRALLNAAINLWIPQNVGNFTSKGPFGFSGRTMLCGVS